MIELFYNYIFKPQDNVLTLAEKKPYLFTFGVVIFAKYSSYIASLLARPLSNHLIYTLTSEFLENFIFFVVLWLLCSLFINVVSSLLGGSGKINILFIALGFSIYPAILHTPAFILFNSLGNTGLMLLGLSKLLILFWIIYLQILAVRKIYNLSSSKAAAAYFSPLILVSFGILLVITLISLFTIALFRVCIPLII